MLPAGSARPHDICSYVFGIYVIVALRVLEIPLLEVLLLS
jgi:hypothetical protein